MPAALIIQLLTTFGPPAITLIEGLITKFEAKGDVTAAEWADLSASLKLTARDHMLAKLKDAGIDPASPQGIAMLTLV